MTAVLRIARPLPPTPHRTSIPKHSLQPPQQHQGLLPCHHRPRLATAALQPTLHKFPILVLQVPPALPLLRPMIQDTPTLADLQVVARYPTVMFLVASPLRPRMSQRHSFTTEMKLSQSPVSTDQLCLVFRPRGAQPGVNTS